MRIEDSNFTVHSSQFTVHGLRGAENETYEDIVKWLIELALHNRLLMVVLCVIVIAGGIYSYTLLPVDAFPDVSPNLVQVFTITEGLAPEEVEQYVTYPVEAAMTGLPGVEKVRSVSNFGLSVVNVYFKDGMDIYFCRQLVNERLQEAREQIPEGFGEPEMGPISTGMGLVLFYYLEDTTGQRSLEELRTLQDWIVKFNLQKYWVSVDTKGSITSS